MQDRALLEECEALERTWTNEFVRAHGWLERHLEDPIENIRLFAERIPGHSMLDAGCGWGRYAWRFAEHGLDYTGVDHATEAVAYARLSCPNLRFDVGTTRAMPYQSNQFDGVWSCCALSSVPKSFMVAILQEHRRVLKPGGIMLTTMALPPFGFGEESMCTSHDGKTKLYQAFYELDEFCDHQKKAGFEIIQCEHDFESGSQHVLARNP